MYRKNSIGRSTYNISILDPKHSRLKHIAITPHIYKPFSRETPLSLPPHTGLQNSFLLNSKKTLKPPSVLQNLSKFSSESTAGSIDCSHRGLTGLRNLGNTCFMNSVLQCLLHTPLFNEYFSDNSTLVQEIHPEAKLRGELALAFNGLVTDCRRGTAAVAPLNIKRLVSKVYHIFRGCNQHDSAEFLRAVLDILHEELNKVRDKPVYREMNGRFRDGVNHVAQEWWDYSLQRGNSIITEIFQGQLMSVIKCGFCSERAVACDCFLDLTLPIAAGGIFSKSRLLDCFRTFVAAGKIPEYRCEHCKKTGKCTQEVSIYRFPKVLVIQLKRFRINGIKREKVTREISIPETLDLAEFCRYSLEKHCRYDLYGVSHHKGSLTSGHYVADCFEEGNWHRFDDSSVSGITPPRNSSSAYVLFYSRR